MLKEKWMQPGVGTQLMGMVKTNFTEKYKKFTIMRHKKASGGLRFQLETQRNDGFGFVTNYQHGKVDQFNNYRIKNPVHQNVIQEIPAVMDAFDGEEENEESDY